MSASTENYHTFFNRPWWAMGQSLDGTGVAGTMVINETATRARAGLLNILSGTTIFILIAAPELDPIRFVGPFVIFDMVVGAIFGLTPFSPAGVMGTLLTMKLRPVWKPTSPKRFAWSLGATLGVCCLTFWLLEWQAWIIGVLGVCFMLTWLEAVMGFCVGCWMYGLLFKCEGCAVR
jgi:hypothetical protein